jgi:CHAT domain-containing protein
MQQQQYFRRAGQWLLGLSLATGFGWVTVSLDWLTWSPLVPLAQAAESTESADQFLEKGSQLYQQQKFRAALASFQAALVMYQKLGDRPREGVALTAIGLSYYQLGLYQKALETFEAAAKVHNAVIHQAQTDSSPDASTAALRSRRLLRETLQSTGLVYYQLAQYEKALTLHQQAFAMSSRGMVDYFDDGMIFNAIGNAYFKLGRQREALEYYHQALVVVDTVGYPLGKTGQGKPSNLVEIQNLIYGWRLQAPRSVPLEVSLKAVLKPDYYNTGRLDRWAQRLLVNTFINLGDVYTEIGTKSTATQFYLQALRMSRYLGDRSLEGKVLVKLGRSFAIDGQPQAAIENYQEALKISEATGDMALKAMTQSYWGSLSLKTGRSDEAVKHLDQAAQAFELQRPGLGDAEQVSLFETQQATYRQLQMALIAKNLPEAALEAAERGRARAFVELLSRRLQVSSQQPNLVRSLNSKQIRQTAKNQNATIVQYSLVSEDKLYVWVIKPSGQIVFRPVDLTKVLFKQDFSTFVNQARSNDLGARGRGIGVVSVRSGQARGSLTDLQRLYQVLIAPIAKELPTSISDRIIFVPQGALFLVPFAALQDNSGKYLIEQHTLSIAPSIQTLELTRAQQVKRNAQPAPLAALIVGNPTMPKVLVEAGKPAEQLAALPGAEREARAIATLLNAEVLTGDAATKAKILQKIPQSRQVHLATHGLLDDFWGIGLPGAIALAPSGQDDGLLTTEEILDLKLNADLVVLSACDTGRGKITGDGVIGLSRAIVAAGTPSVIVSLWAVPDSPTATLMVEFYKQRLRNSSKAQALRQAMLTTMQQYPQPANWAAFVLVGEAE